MLRILNANSTTHYANTISKSDGDGNIEKRDRLIPVLKNLLSIKNAATEINRSKHTKKTPFNIEPLLDVSETKENLLVSIKQLKGRLNQEESLLSKKHLYYTCTQRRLERDLVDTLLKYNQNIFKINKSIPHAKNRVALHDSTCIPPEYDEFITETTTGEKMTMNNCLTYTREKTHQAKTLYEAQATQLHHEFITTLNDTQQSICDINTRLSGLNTKLEQQKSYADETLHRVDINHTYKEAIRNLKSILKQVKSSEKINTLIRYLTASGQRNN